MSDRFVRIRYSKDGGYNWGQWRTITLGQLGDYQTRARARFRQIGIARSICFDIEVSSPIKADIIGAVMQIEGLGV